MSLVGNDVVDLDEPAIASSHLRERFVARVLSVRERRELERTSDVKGFLWARFAAKEAAYKVLSKGPGGPPLAHRQFEVAEDLSSVRHGEAVLQLAIEGDGALVHAVAWRGAARPRWSVERLGEGADPSVAVRAALLEAMGGRPGLEVLREPATHRWDGFGPPRVLERGRPLAVDVSLSHDGRFIAWALAEERADRRRPSPRLHQQDE